MASAASPLETLAGASAGSASGNTSPRQPSPPPKQVQFELLVPETPQCKARLPLRVAIYAHDSTDSIITTVKNFYGLYPRPETGSKGISFEDDRGLTLIASHENFSNNMVVYVRVRDESPGSAVASGPDTFGPAALAAAPVFPSPFPPSSRHAVQSYDHHASRPDSRQSRRRSISPGSARDRRSDSASKKGGRSRSSKTRGPNPDSPSDGYSSGDGAPGSPSSRSKEQLGNTDISVENIVEGGRRKRAKFESSELPLFAPPQMPAATSNSSVSPARRVEHQRPSLPFAHPGQHPFAHPRAIQSPQGYSNGYGNVGMYATPASDSRRHRGSIGYPNTQGILPTPDPTVGSVVSEEDKDVAIQLMRLGEMSNMSHGRTSASTLDDTFSGRADAASSTGATSDGDSDSEEEMPPARRQKLDFTGADRRIYQTTESHFGAPQDGADASGDDADMEDGSGVNHSGAVKLEDAASQALLDGKPASLKMGKPKAFKAPKASSAPKVKKPSALPGGPMSPASLPNQSRKPSIASASVVSGQGGDDDHPDLSSKPRCQRCRKSKKGCDRQRPCGRCKDAGLGADQCISEDEGNGRKGRYGRHMGVPLKATEAAGPPTLLPAAPMPAPVMTNAADKNKKRKR